MSESTVPIWLSVIALASVIQVTMLVAAVVMLAKSARRLQAVVDAVRRDQIAPLTARAHSAIDKVEDVVARVRTYDDDIRGAIERAGERVHQVTDLVRAGSSPILGLVRGASAAFSVLVNGKEQARATRAEERHHVQH